MKKLVFPHAGTILLEEFIKPLGLSQYRVAKDCGIPQSSLTQLIKGNRSLSAENALRLGRYFGIDPRFWINLQAEYDLRLVSGKLEAIEAQVKPFKPAQAA